MSRTSAVATIALDFISAADERRTGAKAYHCGRLTQAGFPVPDGIVVPADAEGADLDRLAVDPWLLAQPADARFAVRSSGIGEDSESVSFAGIHQSLLDVHLNDIRAAVEICRASGRSARAIEYRRTNGLEADCIAMGVLIQRMVDSIAAGVAFTINPVTGRNDEVVINSSWGVGEAVVNGLVEPDEFVVAKADGAVRWSRIGKKDAESSDGPSLTPAQIAELVRLLTEVEQHYGQPQDVEWCHDGQRFWIVQSRPVATVAARTGEAEWTRANIGEVMPDLTCPQALRVFEMLLERADRRFLGKLMAPAEHLGPIVKSFYGRLYFNLSQLRHIAALTGTPPAVMLRSLGHPEAVLPEDEQTVKVRMAQRLSCRPDLLRIAARHLRIERELRAHDARTHQAIERLSAPDRRNYSDEQLWTVVEQWVDEAPAYMETVMLLANVAIHETPLRRICDRVGISYERLVYPQLALGERSLSGQQAFDLVALAGLAQREPKVVECLSRGPAPISHLRFALRGTPFLTGFERFLAVHGHRGRYEYDWSLPRYNEDPSPLIQAIRAHVDAGSTDDAAERTRRQEQEAAQAWRDFERRLSGLRRWMLPRRVRRSIARIKQYYVWRERVRSDVARVLAALRSWHLVLADRFVERGWLDERDDYFFVTFDEIGDVIRGRRQPESLRAIGAARYAEWEDHRGLRLPLLMRPSMLPELLRRSGVTGGPESAALIGQPVSGGCVEGTVVVVHDPADFERMTRGAILVAPSTDPSWTPLFTLAAGVVVEVGGVLSHASTIAREYGLPALANVKHATKRLRTGERVRLDANRGVVERLPALN